MILFTRPEHLEWLTDSFPGSNGIWWYLLPGPNTWSGWRIIFPAPMASDGACYPARTPRLAAGLVSRLQERLMVPFTPPEHVEWLTDEFPGSKGVWLYFLPDPNTWSVWMISFLAPRKDCWFSDGTCYPVWTPRVADRIVFRLQGRLMVLVTRPEHKECLTD
jgi:hypothetical protein